MKATLTKGQTAVAIVLAVIIIDQIIKVWVKTSFYLGEDVELTSWFHMRFIENPFFGIEKQEKELEIFQFERQLTDWMRESVQTESIDAAL